jgi:quercetin dioxygenase-like cupin family protein
MKRRAVERTMSLIRAIRRLRQQDLKRDDEWIEKFMSKRSMTMTKLLIAFYVAAAAAVPAVAQEAKVTPLMTQELSGLAGKEATMVTVEYAPGASSAEHRHNAHTFVYVLEGTLVMQVKGGKEVTLGPGQTFYESPADVHTVSRNASKTQPARFLVFFVKEKGAPTTVPAK